METKLNSFFENQPTKEELPKLVGQRSDTGGEANWKVEDMIIEKIGWLVSADFPKPKR